MNLSVILILVPSEHAECPSWCVDISEILTLVLYTVVNISVIVLINMLIVCINYVHFCAFSEDKVISYYKKIAGSTRGLAIVK